MSLGIVATNLVTPRCSFSTAEMLDVLSYKMSDSMLNTINKLSIDKRYSIIENYPAYLNGEKRIIVESNSVIAERSVLGLINETDIDPKSIGLLVAVTNTPDRQLPCLAYEIMDKKNSVLSREMSVLNIQAQGCSAAFKAFDIIDSYTKANPEKYALLVTSECNTGFFSNVDGVCKSFQELKQQQFCENELRKTMVLISSFMFGDGAVAMLFKQNARCPIEIKDIIHLSNNSHGDSEVLTMNEGGILIPEYSGFPYYHMSEAVPKKCMVYAKQLISKLKARADLANICLDENLPFLIHTGSKKIIDAVCSALKLDRHEDRALYSYNILKNYANLSSVSTCAMIHHFMKDHAKKSHPSSYGIMLSFGVGFSGSSALIKIN